MGDRRKMTDTKKYNILSFPSHTLGKAYTYESTQNKNHKKRKGKRMCVCACVCVCVCVCMGKGGTTELQGTHNSGAA